MFSPGRVVINQQRRARPHDIHHGKRSKLMSRAPSGLRGRMLGATLHPLFCVLVVPKAVLLLNASSQQGDRSAGLAY